MKVKNSTIGQIVQRCQAEIGKLKTIEGYAGSEAAEKVEREISEDILEYYPEGLEGTVDMILNATAEEKFKHYAIQLLGMLYEEIVGYNIVKDREGQGLSTSIDYMEMLAREYDSCFLTKKPFKAQEVY